ncbi:Cof-type HAD-IIB family hydrolase [Domibacillus sp. DTU_2020_1001157_1_SI_ALB_TIR_016]|uniref:Cof-type HAD-IIB family hydrolase n=1 Tax=Domibacillus sp. DTU_2020_1001157_1_SI_ALB_TIR_016 TaxID=3077789 RepID=UPI0028EA5189|nr:Cof-type HAD-IIB family hydrolase [Domibacillus sp. DTU_2020_1001157_1_SI_ALB_TIR_016]WNS78784.1 Cof-type HAD-IIB family hydrolase [Domibacillus sp. DTU_2020_1001157_1_SI_ALB_TIR_016]
MEKKIVFLDLDGTVLNEEKVIPESTKKAVQLLQDKGIYTVISTGRAPQMFDWILKELNIDSYVCINGQFVVFEGKEIYSNPLDPEMLHDINNLAKSKGHALAYCNHQHVKASEENHPFISISFETLKMDYPMVDSYFYKHSPVYQGHLYCDIHDAQVYIERYPEYNFVRWDEYAADILPKGCSKAIGIQKILEAAGVKKENSYAFGDGLNDLEMLTLVGTGIAMGNAVPEAKAAADFITTSCSEDGILNGLISLGLLEEDHKNEIFSVAE